MRRRRIALIAGGRSSEHEISLASARSVLEALDSGDNDVVTVSIARDGTWRLGAPGSHALVPGPQSRPLETKTGAEEERTSARLAGESASSGHGEGPGPWAGPAETLPVPATSASVTQTLAEVDVVFPILHGPFGEDGAVQGLLELANVPYVGAGVAASALCMDKDLFKSVMRDHGIPVTRNVTLRHGAPLD